jgi:hypothetical protein
MLCLVYCIHHQCKVIVACCAICLASWEGKYDKLGRILKYGGGKYQKIGTPTKVLFCMTAKNRENYGVTYLSHHSAILLFFSFNLLCSFPQATPVHFFLFFLNICFRFVDLGSPPPLQFAVHLGSMPYSCIPAHC